MLSPEFLQSISQDLVELYTSMETDLMTNIARKLALNKEMFIDTVDKTRKVNEWQLERLKQIKGLTLENAEIISKQSGVSVRIVNSIFERALETGTKADETLIEQGVKAGILNEIVPINESSRVLKALQLAKSTTLTTLNAVNKSILANCNKEYLIIVNKVTAKVVAGTQTVKEAMKHSVRELANQGITSFTAKNGARWSSEAYISMLTSANLKNMVNEVQEQRITESGGDYIEINSYAGARPKCSIDQGKIYSLCGSTKSIVDINGNKITPLAWKSSTYGQPDGILGINCGHQRFIFIPGLSGFNREEISQEENTKEYKEKQQQRFLERQIRNSKRERAMLEETGVDSSTINDIKNKIFVKQKELKNFIEETGRTRIRANEWIG